MQSATRWNRTWWIGSVRAFEGGRTVRWSKVGSARWG